MSAPSSIPTFAGAFILDSNGNILCQLRDEKAGILFPGHWTCTPGGHVKPGEDPADTIQREIYEEFEVRAKDVRFFKKYEELRDVEAKGIYHIFVIHSATPAAEICCHEGQKAIYFAPQKILDLKQHPISRKALLEYLEVMDANLAYIELRAWAKRVGSDLPEFTEAHERLNAFVQCVAALRLSNIAYPEEPSRDAVQALYLEANPSQGRSPSMPEISQELEKKIGLAAQKMIKALENQPFFGCKDKKKKS